MTKSDDTLLAAFNKLLFIFVIGLPVGLLTSLLRAWTIVTVWGWYVQPRLGVSLNIAAAYGIYATFTLLRGFPVSDRIAAGDPVVKDRSVYKATFENAVISILFSLGTLAGAYLFRFVA